MANKILIGLTGETGAGKDTFCEYVKKNYPNVFVLKFSDTLTDILKIFFDSIKKEDQQWLGFLLKERFGDDILVRALIRKANSINEGIIILNGVRAEGEAEAIKKNSGKIVYVTADEKVRWERVKTRGEKTDDNVSFEKFLEIGKAPVELQIKGIGSNAEFKIENNGEEELLHKEIKKVIDSIQ